MRNSIVFKFIAIFLCAASLLGAIGGLAGVVVLTEGDLYHKTVAEVRAERIQQNVSQYASDLVRIYAGTNLGNMPESIVTDQLPWSEWFYRRFPAFGYTILDAEGNPVSQYNEGLKETAATYSFPAEGQYMHLVSTGEVPTEPVVEETLVSDSGSMEHWGFEIPAEGLEVNSIYMSDSSGNDLYQASSLGSIAVSKYRRANGTYHNYSDAWSGPIGYIGYNAQGRLYYQSYLNEVKVDTVYPQHDVAYIDLQTYDGESHQLSGEGNQSIGTLALKAGNVYFQSGTGSTETTTATAAVVVDRSTIPLAGDLDIYKASFYGQDGNLLYEAQLVSETKTQNGQTSEILKAKVTNYMAGSDAATSYTSAKHSDPVGFVSYDAGGNLYYASLLYDVDQTYPDREVSRIYLQAKDSSHYIDLRTFDIQNSLGTLEVRSGTIYFRSSIRRAAAASETQPGWAVETTPDSDSLVLVSPEGTRTEVILPQDALVLPQDSLVLPTEVISVDPAAPAETVIPAETPSPAETAAEETVIPETTASSASALPEATVAAEETTIPETAAAEETAAASTLAAAAPTETAPPEALPAMIAETLPPETEPITIINGKPLSEYQVNTRHYWDQERQEYIAKYVYLPMPEMTVEVYIDESQITDNVYYYLLEVLYGYRDDLLPLIGLSLLVFVIFTVYLCTAAGRRPKSDEVRAGGLNRMPLDLYLCGGCFLAACFLALLFEGTPEILSRDLTLGCAFALAMAFLSCLIFVGFCYALVAQIKTPNGFWWRNTLCGHTFRLTFRLALWLETFLAGKGFPLLGTVIHALWRFTVKSLIWIYNTSEQLLLWFCRKLGRIFRWLFHKLRRFLSLLPLTWQWLLGGLTLLFTGLLTWANRGDGWGFLWLLLGLGLVLYVSHCFGLLSESAKRMSKGDLDTKVEDKLMAGCFQDFASDLNNLADVAVVAAQKQLKSERMKTELITNVSHDIKTPLTSIINYVDLLQKPHTEEEEEQYLEVLDRQSQRLKKLIDDLMDMSKANTGNMQVDITRLDAVEAVNQALGEFADKLDRALLIPVFRHDQDHVPMMADGRLVWRVLSNLLSNAVKYAMPGTRLYLDLMTLEGKVVISLKNISREELNIDADELMERFVRGDDSRNTEGSGLGLNIAKSLMELQKGQLQLLVDGDLFKVTLVFPGA